MLDIDSIVNIFELQLSAQRTLRTLYSTLEVKRRNVDYCLEYFRRCVHKNFVNQALYSYNSTGLNLITEDFDYNLFNRPILNCVFYSLIGYNVSRIDNLEKIIILLFPTELQQYNDDRKTFSFAKLCSQFDSTNLIEILKPILTSNGNFKNIQELRNQMEHSSTENILINDTLCYNESDFFVDERFTLSTQKEHIVDFAQNLNVLLSTIEKELFRGIIAFGKDCLRKVQKG